MKLFDSHCHLQFPQFDEDRGAVLARMQEKDMGAVLIGTDLETSRSALALAKQYNFLWAAVGLHPNDNKDENFEVSKYRELAKDPKVVAIGECGLDYFRSEKSEGQKERFEQHIRLAQELNKPLIVHCRNADDDMLAILLKEKLRIPVVMHFFTGSGELAQKYLDLGCYLSFPGPVTYTDRYNDSMRLVPLDRLLIETDAPFAAPVPNRGKRNEPPFVAYVAEKVAKIKGISPDEIAVAATENALRVFTIIP